VCFVVLGELIICAHCLLLDPLFDTQINTPDGISDYFLPLRFDVRESTNELVADLLETL